MLESFGLSDVGRRRTLNEDSFAVSEEAAYAAVCDGLGGQNAGEVASQLSIETIGAFLIRSHQDKEITWPYGLVAQLSFDGNRLLTAIGLANKRVFRVADQQPEYSGLGTTVVAAIVRNATLTVAWVGDSRAYLIRGGKLQRLTEDHTWVNMAVREGTITREEAEKHPWKHVLTRAIGSRETVQSDIIEQLLEPEDIVLLCSDGLTTMLDDAQILTLLSPPPSTLPEGARKLVDAALEAGGKDNVTVILMRHRA
jgi:protein phosphatase